MCYNRSVRGGAPRPPPPEGGSEMFKPSEIALMILVAIGILVVWFAKAAGL